MTKGKRLKKFKLLISLFLAISIPVMPLAVVSMAWASPLDDAQSNLIAGQQELINATLDKHDADALVDSAYLDLQGAQTAVAAAQTAYDTDLIPQVTSTGSGLSVDIYNNTISRTPNPANLCRHDTVSQISANWGSGQVLGCGYDRVTVHYYGTLTVPTSGNYQFMNLADDGFYMTLDGNLIINDWRDKGCSGNWYSTQLEAGHTYTLDAWYYENGGGACSTLYYQSSNNWGVVPASWFGSASVTTMVPDPAKLDALTAAQSALASAQTAYDAALAAQVTAALRLQAASDAIPGLEQAVVDATPVIVPQPEPTPAPSDTPQIPEPTPTETTTPSPEPSTTPQTSDPQSTSQPEPSTTPVVEPSATPEPSPAPEPIPVPVVQEPQVPIVPPVTEPPVVVPVPQPQPIPYPVVDPAPVVVPPAPVETPAPTPVPLPSESPSAQLTTAPVPVETPPPAPVPVVTATPATPPVQPVVPPVVPPVPPVVEPTKDVSNIATVDLKAIDPQSLSTAEVAQLITAADVVLGTVAESSPQYAKALEALAVAAQADDPQVPEALANIPGVGQAAVAVLNAFNTLGNFGADMSPAHRKTAKKEVVAAIVLTQVTSAAVGAATSAASSPSSRKQK